MTNLNYLEEIARSDAAMDVALLEKSAKNWLALMTAPPGSVFTWAPQESKRRQPKPDMNQTDYLDLPDWW